MNLRLISLTMIRVFVVFPTGTSWFEFQIQNLYSQVPPRPTCPGTPDPKTIQSILFNRPCKRENWIIPQILKVWIIKNFLKIKQKPDNDPLLIKGICGVPFIIYFAKVSRVARQKYIYYKESRERTFHLFWGIRHLSFGGMIGQPISDTKDYSIFISLIFWWDKSLIILLPLIVASNIQISFFCLLLISRSRKYKSVRQMKERFLSKNFITCFLVIFEFN
jgi:hypothetical protein